MGSREMWCAEKISKLTNEDERIFTLNEIKEYFASLSQEEANRTANVLQLPIVFDCLNDSKSEQIDLACDVLSLCMSNLSIGESANRYGTLLERALYHPSANVKIMALRELYRTASNRESISELNKHTPLITALVVCVGDDDLAVAKKASDILVLIGKTKDGLKQLLSQQIKQDLSQTIAISDIVRFRVYEILVEIASDSNDSLQSLLATGLISSLVSELDTNDPLLQLNVIELLTNLAYTSHGLQYLEAERVVQKIFTKMASMSEDPLASLLLPGYIKFFGNVAHWRPTEIFAQYPFAINVVYDIINSQDLNIMGVALDTLGYVASTTDGKYVLEGTGDNLKTTIKSIGTQLSTLPTELQIRALQCIENLIRVPIPQQNNRVCSLVETWFNLIDSDSLGQILRYAQNPFFEIRIAGLNVIQAIAELLWGQQMIKNCPGLVEFLTDRTVETSKDCKEIKYEVVKALSVSSVFSENVLVRLQQFVKEGPFYVQGVTEVAVEGGS